ncbi:MAG: hypothetical protein V9F04_01210 [Dermatophilaceae bacterium]
MLLGTGEWDEAVKKIEAVRHHARRRRGKTRRQLRTRDPGADRTPTRSTVDASRKARRGYVHAALARASSKVLKRASEWDDQSAAWTAAASKPDRSRQGRGRRQGPRKTKPPPRAEEKKDSDEIIKRTPAGPVKIPVKRPDGG